MNESNTEIYLGPPGTGKTTKLIELVERELKRKVSPDQIGYVSFTRKAAQEAIDRATRNLKMERKEFPHFSTLHSLCFRQLGLQRGVVMENKRLQEFSKYAGVRVTGRWSEDGTLSGFDVGDRILFMENLARIRGLSLRQAYDRDDDGLSWTEVQRVSKMLVEFKREHGLLDFTDMLSEFVTSKIRLNLRTLFLDESQDFSPLQWRAVEKLSEGCEKVLVAGDDDQAIYPWAGADVEHLISLPGKVHVLGQSWRVPPAVQKIALGIINRIKRRRIKKWSARTGEDGVVQRALRFSDVDVDEKWTDNTVPVLVLARNDYVLKEQVEPELRRRGVIWERHGHSSISAGLMEVVHDWEHLRSGKDVTVGAVRKIYEWMSVGVGFKRGFKTLPDWDEDQEVNLVDLRERGGLLTDKPWHDALDRLPREEVAYVRAARTRGERLTLRPRVMLSTIHGAKGGEARHVVVMKEMARRSYREMQKNIDDEVRVWYVAVTRTKETLTIVESQTPQRCPWI